MRTRIIKSIGTLGVVCGLVAVSGEAHAGYNAIWGNFNYQTTLFVGQSLYSPYSGFRLTMQEDGNLVLYQEPGAIARWWSNTMYSSNWDYAVMQADGNFVVYNFLGSPVWNSGTVNHSGDKLAVQDDGNLVIYHNGAIWNTRTAGSFHAGPRHDSTVTDVWALSSSSAAAFGLYVLRYAECGKVCANNSYGQCTAFVSRHQDNYCWLYNVSNPISTKVTNSYTWEYSFGIKRVITATGGN